MIANDGHVVQVEISNLLRLDFDVGILTQGSTRCDRCHLGGAQDGGALLEGASKRAGLFVAFPNAREPGVLRDLSCRCGPLDELLTHDRIGDGDGVVAAEAGVAEAVVDGVDRIAQALQADERERVASDVAANLVV